MGRLFLILLLLATLNIQLFGQKIKHSFTLSKSEFLLDGNPYQIISGEIHPARVPAEYWKHRIKMAKAMGCNTIAAYIFWNYHEIKKDIFDFRTGNHSISQFIRMVQNEEIFLILRPDPYVYAEWDFGGLPAYLLAIPDIRVRCMDARYTEAAERYIKALAKQVKSL